MVLFRVSGLMSTQRNYIPFDCKVYADTKEVAAKLVIGHIMVEEMYGKDRYLKIHDVLAEPVKE